MDCPRITRRILKIKIQPKESRQAVHFLRVFPITKREKRVGVCLYYLQSAPIVPSAFFKDFFTKKLHFFHCHFFPLFNIPGQSMPGIVHHYESFCKIQALFCHFRLAIRRILKGHRPSKKQAPQLKVYFSLYPSFFLLAIHTAQAPRPPGFFPSYKGASGVGPL